MIVSENDSCAPSPLLLFILTVIPTLIAFLCLSILSLSVSSSPFKIESCTAVVSLIFLFPPPPPL